MIEFLALHAACLMQMIDDGASRSLENQSNNDEDDNRCNHSKHQKIRVPLFDKGPSRSHEWVLLRGDSFLTIEKILHALDSYCSLFPEIRASTVRPVDEIFNVVRVICFVLSLRRVGNGAI